MAREYRAVRGTVLLIVACVVFAGGSCLVRVAAAQGAARIALFRFVVGLGLIASAALTGRIKLQFRNRRLLLLRGLAGGAASAITFLAITRLGLGKGTLIMCSYPIFACIFSAIFLKERFGPIHVVALAGSLGGVYLLGVSGSRGGVGGFGLYELITLGGAVLAGIALTAIRKLHDTDTSVGIYFAQCAVGMWLVLFPGLAGHADLSLTDAMLLVAIGASTTVGQLLMTEGYKYLPVRTGSLLCMLDPVLAFFAGVMIFREPLTVFSAAGAALVVGACVLVLSGPGRPEGGAEIIAAAA